MYPDWLSSIGLPIEGDAATGFHFGDASQELAAASNGTVIAPLAHLGLIRLVGEDTQAFLQGQCSSDVRLVTSEHAQYSSYSTAKGRMLASFLLWRDQESYYLQLSADLRDAVQKRLSMYILRSKVKASDPVEERVCLGLAGPIAETLLKNVFGGVPGDDYAVQHWPQASVIRVPKLGFIVSAAREAVGDLWGQFVSQGAVPVGTAAWNWREVRAGLVRITGGTQELFVPQMANMDLVGAVSFNKGCYPGQEIVARTQYLGKLKKRAFLVHVDGNAAVQAGQSVYAGDFGEQATGQVANAAPAPGGGHDALVVVHMSSIEHALHLGAPDGPALTVQTQPYALPS